MQLILIVLYSEGRFYEKKEGCTMHPLKNNVRYGRSGYTTGGFLHIHDFLTLRWRMKPTRIRYQPMVRELTIVNARELKNES